MEKNQNSKYKMDDMPASKHNAKKGDQPANSDSSEDLTDLSSPTPFDIEKLKKNDIIWAEFRHIYWPAIVRKVNINSKKLTIWYCDSPGKSFKLSFSRIRSFRDMEFRKKALDQQMSPEMNQLYTKVFDLARTYDERRAIGVNDDPALYFHSTKPYFAFLYEDLIKLGILYQQESENKGNNKSAQASGSEIPSNKENVASCSYETNGDEESSDCGQDSYFVDSSDAESVLDSETERRNAEFYAHLNDNSDACDEETADAIVSYIKSGLLIEYLKDIYRGKIESKNQDIFNKGLKEGKRDILWNCSSNVRIAEYQKVGELFDYLLALYDRTVPRKDWLIDYVVTVWLYEALDKAYSLIKGEPSNVSIPSDAPNHPGPSDENLLSAEVEPSVTNTDQLGGRKLLGKSSPKKRTVIKREIRSRNKVQIKNSVKKPKSLKACESSDEMDSDDSEELQKNEKPRRKKNINNKKVGIRKTRSSSKKNC
ncbi:uncharacterized protein NPIL_518931 [Nephila pilipes]|uniref:Uncharacterized protein n=1 Tax=Nephila pilipes TaxID=299642 RepID=A0A8X6TTY2_NEPPI|nr:uncharacterized protein NPIL_518931 [Nephila pilipes]